MNSETMLLPVKLTDAEVLAKSKSAAEKMRLLRVLKDDLKEHIADVKDRIKEEEAAHARLSVEIGDGQELRNINVNVEMFPHRKVAEYTRVDTGEIVRERAMTTAELDECLQAELFAIDGGKAKPAGKGKRKKEGLLFDDPKDAPKDAPKDMDRYDVGEG